MSNLGKISNLINYIKQQDLYKEYQEKVGSWFNMFEYPEHLTWAIEMLNKRNKEEYKNKLIPILQNEDYFICLFDKEYHFVSWESGKVNTFKTQEEVWDKFLKPSILEEMSG